MKSNVLLAIDQGTTGSRAILFDSRGKVVSSSYQEFRQYYPKPGWVEHEPREIWKSCQRVIQDALRKARRTGQNVVSVGITNQRETVILWDRQSGKPVYPAIVWQDRRTADRCRQLRNRGYEREVREKTGLVIDPYFSATKISWLFEKVPGLKHKVRKKQILFGTIDSWILWNLTGGREHKTDFTNASRTLLFNIKTKKWDTGLLKTFGISAELLPEVTTSAGLFGKTVKTAALEGGIPVHAMIGDQQAALYGQGCYHPGDSKNTYGTGCFVVTNLGKNYQKPPYGLLATLACDREGRPVYALEGSIFIAGAAIQWLRDGLAIFSHARDSQKMAESVSDSGGVTMIPALAGLGAPYWNPHVRGIISGLTRGTRREHIVRATLEGIAHQSADVIEKMNQSSKKHLSIKKLKVDGGATANRFLMQFQADILGMPIEVSHIAESTAWGAAKLAAMKSGFWGNLKSIDRHQKYHRYQPRMKPVLRRALRKKWTQEVRRLISS